MHVMVSLSHKWYSNHDGGGGVSGTSFTVTMDMQTLYSSSKDDMGLEQSV